MPAAAPPTPWSPWAPDCPIPWTEEHRRLLLPRRRGEEKIEPKPVAEAWARLRWSFAQAEPWWRQQIGQEDNPHSSLIATLCEQWGTEEAPQPRDPEVEALGLGTVAWAPWSPPGIQEDVVDFWVGAAGFPFALAALVADVLCEAPLQVFRRSSQAGITTSAPTPGSVIPIRRST